MTAAFYQAQRQEQTLTSAAEILPLNVVLALKAQVAGGIMPATSFHSPFVLCVHFCTECHLQENNLNK